jgi:hypothetical protein
VKARVKWFVVLRELELLASRRANIFDCTEGGVFRMTLGDGKVKLSRGRLRELCGEAIALCR